MMWLGISIQQITKYKNHLYMDLQEHISSLKKELEIIEEKEGTKGDEYCKHLLNNIAIYQRKEQLEEFLKDFMLDYSPAEPRLAREFYKSLCDTFIFPMLNDSSNKEHTYWLDNYVKYKTLEIEHSKKLGRKEVESGYYHLGVVYSGEYAITGNELYYSKAKQLFLEVKGELYLMAQHELSILEG